MVESDVIRKTATGHAGIEGKKQRVQKDPHKLRSDGREDLVGSKKGRGVRRGGKRMEQKQKPRALPLDSSRPRPDRV